jgi:hypothetical protein
MMADMSIVMLRLFELGGAVFESRGAGFALGGNATGWRFGRSNWELGCGASGYIADVLGKSPRSGTRSRLQGGVPFGRDCYGFTFTPVAPRTLPSLDSWMKAMMRRFLGSVSGFSFSVMS